MRESVDDHIRDRLSLMSRDLAIHFGRIVDIEQEFQSEYTAVVNKLEEGPDPDDELFRQLQTKIKEREARKIGQKTKRYNILGQEKILPERDEPDYVKA